MAAQKKVDYDAIEPGWRAGIKSPAQLATEYTNETGVSVSRSAIIKHFEKLGVPRDLTAKVQALVKVSDLDEFQTSGFVYVIGIQSPARFFKIGMAKAFPARMEAHQCASPFDLFVACAYFAPNMRFEERALHARFAKQRVRGEWFTLSDGDLVEISRRSLLVGAAE